MNMGINPLLLITDHFALFKIDNPFFEKVHYITVMGGDQNRCATQINTAQQIHDIKSRFRIKVAGWQ